MIDERVKSDVVEFIMSGIGFAMAGSSPVITRRSESQPCMEGYSIDLNKHAPDLNGMAMISSEAPLRFERYPVAPGQANAAYAYATTNFWMPQAIVVNPWIKQDAGPYFWAPQIVGSWNHALSNELDCFQKPRRSDGDFLSAANVSNQTQLDFNDATRKHQQSKVSNHVLKQVGAQQPHANDQPVAASELQGLHANDKTLKPAKDQHSDVNDQTLGKAKLENPHVDDQLHPRSNNAVPRYQQSLVEIIESPDWLPPGWITEVKTRKSGSTAGTKDKYYMEPVSCRRFRSKNEVMCYLQMGQFSRYRPKVPHHEGTGASSSASSFSKKSLYNAGAQSTSSHHVGDHPASLCSIESQLNYSACSVPLTIQSDIFCKVASMETAYIASSIQCISNQSLETAPDSLNEVLPVGHSDGQSISNCNSSISPAVSQSAISVQLPSLLDEEWLMMENKHGAKNGTSMDGSDPNFTSQDKEIDSFFQRKHGANLDGYNSSFKQQRIHEAVGEGQQEFQDGMLNRQIGNPATPLTSIKNVGNARQSLHCINGNAASRSGTSRKQSQVEILGWKNVTLPMPSQPLKDMLNASQVFQDTTENNTNRFGPSLHLKGSYLNQIGLKKTQKLKPRQRKELLAVLGRKLCWQGLGLLVQGVQTLPF